MSDEKTPDPEVLGEVLTPPPGGSVHFQKMDPARHAGPVQPVQATQSGPRVTVIPGNAPPRKIAQAGPGAGDQAAPPDGGGGGDDDDRSVLDQVIDEDTRAYMAYARHAGNPLSIEIRGPVTIVSPSPVQVTHAADPDTGAELVHVEPADPSLADDDTDNDAGDE